MGAAAVAVAAERVAREVQRRAGLPDHLVSDLADPLGAVEHRQVVDVRERLRGRLGLAFDRVLVYGTGGFAYGDVDTQADFFRNTYRALQFTGRKGDIETGYTVGGGIEYSLPTGSLALFNSSAVTLRAEYLYYDLGDRNIVVQGIPGVGVNSYSARFQTEGHVARAGINFKFGG